MIEIGKIKTPVVLGTSRMGRRSEEVAKFVLGEANRRTDIEAGFIDVRDFRMIRTVHPEDPDQDAKRWREIARAADAFIIVSPEYNRGYPGELKMLLDSAYDEYEKKPVGICGVSDGGFGGARMVENLKPILIELGLIPIVPAVHFSRVNELFTSAGVLSDPKLLKSLSKFFDELVSMAKVLIAGKDALK